METNVKDTRKSRLIFDAKIARKLLKQGFVVIDIKPNRENTDKTIFVFENTDEFKIALEKLMDELKAKKEAEIEIEFEGEIEVEIDID
jgi:translation initiation factor 1 (eIF-1/SUI1)